jgi:hypothetical protein
VIARILLSSFVFIIGGGLLFLGIIAMNAPTPTMGVLLAPIGGMFILAVLVTNIYLGCSKIDE